MDTKLSRKDYFGRFVLAVLFISTGYITYIVFSPFRPLLDELNPAYDYLGRIGLITALLAVLLVMNRNPSWSLYRPIFRGLLIMATAVSLDWVFAIFLADHLGITGSTPFSAALQKLNEWLIITSVVVSLSLLSGDSLGSIYIQKGNLKSGLTTGIIAFALAAAASPWMATYLFKAQNLTLDRVLGWLPWLLLFVLANAAEEELLFRGLFLRKLQPFYGRLLSNLIIVFVFTFLHYGVTYTSSDLMFLAAIIPLALAWGYIMQKTDSIWGSILFHAGMDIPILLGIFSNM